MKRSLLCNSRSTAIVLIGCFTVYVVWNLKERMSEDTLDYFLSRSQIQRRDAAQLRWSHAVNSRSRLTEALTATGNHWRAAKETHAALEPQAADLLVYLQPRKLDSCGSTHILEADIIMRGVDPREPIMAHPPETDSDITLKEWLEGVKEHDKGIKLDFKSLEAVSPSVALLEEVLTETSRPVWINADILPGPGGQATPLDPQAFLSAVKTLPTGMVLSLGWTTGWTAGTDNPGYSWDMVRAMQDICGSLKHPVTFPVRAALLAQSLSQLSWLLQQSDRYTLTVWTGQNDTLTLQDLLPYRKQFDISRIYYDLPDSLRTELSMTSHDRD